MRADQRRAVPDLLLGGLHEPPGERVARRLPGQWRRVRLVAQGQPAGRGLLGGDLGVGRRERAGERPRAAGAARRRSRRRRRGTRRPRSAARRATRRPRGSRGGGCSAAGGSARRSTARRRRPASRLRRAGRSPPGGATASRRPGASPRARTGRSAAARPAPLARRARPLTRIRLRPAAARCPARTIATSIVSWPTRPSTRASSVPQRISSPSVAVRCERPQASRTIASRRLVLPAAFGPQTRCGPGPNAASSDA